MRSQVNYACAIGTRLNLDLCVLFKMASCENFAELQLAKTATLATLQTNGLKGATTMKAISFCA